MFGTVRKHQQWLWIAIIVPTILSFVTWLSPEMRRRGPGSGGSGEFGTLGGRPLTQDMFIRAQNEAKVYGLLFYGGFDTAQARQMGFDLQRVALQRLLLAEKIRELDIQVPDEAIAAWVRENFKDPQT